MPELFNRTTGSFEEALVISPIGQQDIDEYAAQWLPPMLQRVDELRQRGPLTRQMLAENNVEDAHWEWPEKWLARTALEWNSFALRCGGRTQGLMFVNLLPRARLPSQATQHLAYIDLLSTAPWNRPRLAPTPTYRGVGALLVTEAILLSKDEGFEGRIALHSLPGAVDFYEHKCGMANLGADPGYHDLPYFEMTPAQAAAFLET